MTNSVDQGVPSEPASRDRLHWQLAAEAITVRIRWFGLCVGYVLVNVFSPVETRPQLNGILTLGAVYAIVDTFWSLRGRVFLSNAPLFVSAMEAVFIGLLCYFDRGLESPFRFYYFLSLLVCAIRYRPAVTYLTFALHAVSFTTLALVRDEPEPNAAGLVLMLVLLGWVTWASAALADLVKQASRDLLGLNRKLQNNQTQLEQRIADRTKELQESQALLVQQEKQAAFGLLAAGIAHEVGNPLAAISSLVQMMDRRELNDYMHERLRMIDDQLRRIQRTLRELVDFSRPADRLAVTCDVHEVISAAINIAKYYKRMKGRTIRTEYGERLGYVHVVRDQLVQVFLNLILNALDATDEGGELVIRTSRRGDRLRIDVTDDGTGIGKADRARLFEPYFTTKPTGTGLGLFVCSKILDEAGGSIALVDSSPDGSTFRVSLPIAEEAATEERTALPTPTNVEV